MASGPKKKVKAAELRRLSARFHKLDLDSSGALSADEFLTLPELQNNPLVRRVVDILDSDGDGEVDFAEFIEGISRFTINGTKEEKLKSGHFVRRADPPCRSRLPDLRRGPRRLHHQRRAVQRAQDHGGPQPARRAAPADRGQEHHLGRRRWRRQSLLPRVLHDGWGPGLPLKDAGGNLSRVD